MFVIDLINYLNANVPFTYYPNKFPAKGADDSASVKLTGGGSPEYIEQIKNPTFQILVRAEHPSNAEAKANELFAFLNGKTHFQVGSVKVAYCRANQSTPIFIGEDDNERSIYSLNFTCKTVG